MNEKNSICAPLMAIDALGRKTADRTEAPAPRKNRQVGMFYFLWLGEEGRHAPRNISEMVAANPHIGYETDNPAWGPIGFYHHWGEPFYGYYYSDDEWVVRHHMKLLIEADIDFLFFDTTNGPTYDKNTKLVMKVLHEYAQEGWKIPKVMFYTNTASGQTVQHIYDTIYKPEYCPDTWFYFEGKPVIIAVEKECSPECRDFFNIKMSQWPNEPDKLGGWPWMDFVRPQRVFGNLKGEPEVINVSVAQHPQIRFGDSVLYGETTNCGRGFHNGANDPDSDAYKKGYNFGEQMARAIETDPPVVLVTGWNEWIAGRWQGTKERPILFVDCANYEYSRDLEMMRGGYFDNYFLQLVDGVRRYKGMPETKVFAQNTEAVYPNFTDGDFARHAEGYGCVYDNTTARNAITEIRVKHDAENVVFALKTKAPLTADRAGTWMNLYLKIDGGAGYDYIINEERTGNEAAVGKVTEGLITEKVAKAKLAVGTDTVTLTVRRADLGIADRDFTLWFKAADANAAITSVEDFYDKGDVAPLGRLNYVYSAKN